MDGIDGIRGRSSSLEGGGGSFPLAQIISMPDPIAGLA